MSRGVRTRATKKRSRVDRAMLGNNDVMRNNILAAGALQAHHVPSVINLQVSTRHDNVNQRAAGRWVGASKHHPIRMIDAAAELPSPAHAEAAADWMRDSLRRERPGDQAVAPVTKDFILSSIGERAHAPMMSTHHHQHPSARRASLGNRSHRVSKTAEREFITAE